MLAIDVKALRARTFEFSRCSVTVDLTYWVIGVERLAAEDGGYRAFSFLCFLLVVYRHRAQPCDDAGPRWKPGGR